MKKTEKEELKGPGTELCEEDGRGEEGEEGAGEGCKCGPVTSGWKET